MSRKCDLTGKKTSSGNNRPFSLKITKRTFRPNLFKRKMFNPLTGKVERMTLSAKAIKTLKKWAKENGFSTEYKSTATAQPKKGEAHKAGEGKHVHKQKLTPKQKKEITAQKEAATMTGKNPVAPKTEDKKTEK
jgi:large subunit ribosomal protein L28